MTLKQNLIDNILECEAKLGFAKIPISFYYPKSSLTELLNCEDGDLASAIQKFQTDEMDKFGQVLIHELINEKGRFEVTVPQTGVEWVHENYRPSEFTFAFVKLIKEPGKTISDLINLFRGFSEAVDVKKMSDTQWSICFEDESIDPYIYHIEQNVFGLEYHRFTRKAYELIRE